jgi:methionine sulfoxide reductase catalytic subunit
MANVIIRPDWHIPESSITPINEYHNRRSFVKQLGLGAGVAGLSLADTLEAAAAPKLYPAKRNAKYSPKVVLTNKAWATGYNNFYEFTTSKEQVRFLVDKFKTNPWEVEVSGLCGKPFKFDALEMAKKLGLEERVYRFRCVEAWSMIVPWTGYTLSKLLKQAEPKASAKYVKFYTAMKPAEMPGLARLPQYPWPYTEGLRLDEAMHDLTFMATGIFGESLPKQNGAPLRLVVPWKYGYKSIKSIVKIELTDRQPKTLWNALSPREYPFESNVNPGVPHPRWSQASERLIGPNPVRIKTIKYNGYPQVAGLYK